MTKKSKRIRRLVAWLRPQVEFAIVDHWEGDLIAIGLACKEDHHQLVYIAEKQGKRTYFVELETAPNAGTDFPYKCIARLEGLPRRNLPAIIRSHFHAND